MEVRVNSLIHWVTFSLMPMIQLTYTSLFFPFVVHGLTSFHLFHILKLDFIPEILLRLNNADSNITFRLCGIGLFLFIFFILDFSLTFFFVALFLFTLCFQILTNLHRRKKGGQK